jgi:hypothetical protein
MTPPSMPELVADAVRLVSAHVKLVGETGKPG